MESFYLSAGRKTDDEGLPLLDESKLGMIILSFR